MKKYEVDARGLDCPRPLLRTKEAISSQEFDSLSVLVSNVPARENVVRYLGHAGFQSVHWDETENPEEFTITASSPSESGEEREREDTEKSRPPINERNPVKATEPAAASGKTIFIGSNRIGMGKKELGYLLMKGYLYTLTQLTTPPGCLVFMNTGVELTLDDSESLDDLKVLEKKGVSLMVCGTCLDFLNVRERMQVGQISNMYEIAEKLNGPGGVLTFT